MVETVCQLDNLGYHRMRAFFRFTYFAYLNLLPVFLYVCYVFTVSFRMIKESWILSMGVKNDCEQPCVCWARILCNSNTHPGMRILNGI